MEMDIFLPCCQGDLETCTEQLITSSDLMQKLTMYTTDLKMVKLIQIYPVEFKHIGTN